MKRGHRISGPGLPLTSAALAAALSGCFSLPPPPPATASSAVGDPAPAFTLAASGPTPGTLSLEDLRRSGPAVLIFYRGDW